MDRLLYVDCFFWQLCLCELTNLNFGSISCEKHKREKAKKLVINNIENKLLKIICAVIRTKTPYIQGYHSVHPHLLKPQLQLT